MRNQNLKLKILSLLVAGRGCFLIFSFQLLVIFGLCGCSVVNFLTPEGSPSDKQITMMYEQTKLKSSNASDVLAMVEGQLAIADYQLLSQSRSVIALHGQKKKGYKNWFNMVTFQEGTLGEYELTANRKCLFIVDEKPKFLFVEPWASLKFDCEMVLESEVLEQPYADENSRRIAILKQVLANVAKDMKELASDNKKLAVCGMLVNQALNAALVRLNSSPALAVRLSEPAGLRFEHRSFDKGKIRMLVTGDIATVEIRLGSIVKRRLEWTGKILEYESGG